MKQKIKLWILQIEGWKRLPTAIVLLRKKGYMTKEVQPWAKNQDTAFHFLHEAWSAQFATWKDYLKTNLFWLLFTPILGALFALFSDHSTVIKNGIHWFNYASGICFLYPVGWTVCALCYMAWRNVVKLFFKYIKTKIK